MRVDYVVIAASHTDEVITPDGRFTTEAAKQEIVDKVVLPVVGDLVDNNTKIMVNGTGKFLVSGPQCADRTQDHRGHIWRLDGPRRWSFQRKGSDES